MQKKPIGDQYDLNIDVSLEQAEALKSASIWWTKRLLLLKTHQYKETMCSICSLHQTKCKKTKTLSWENPKDRKEFWFSRF